ncbi:phage major capsid protein [Maritalea porphyrae]|uniref:phage major capsid protein n=1 Tax=Maritalea porphyrae TaxID=880732 RepID=UPI0022AF0142|nr:phage major capsid protein [Maritalea porphyrae]MCZ4271160.1 phage major capsid protein [Maritalea porphyrae]
MTTKPSHDFEVKAHARADATDDVTHLFDDFMHAFEEFKSTNDARLSAIESKKEDILLDQKLDRLNRAMDSQNTTMQNLLAKQMRPSLAPSSVLLTGDNEYKDAFSAYVRKGEEKSLSAGSNPDGGYLVPAETDMDIGRRLAAISPIRSIASVRQVSSSVYKKPVATSGPAVGWVGEADARPETTASTLAEIEYPTTELYAMPAATASFLDDAAVDVEQWIAEEVEAAFAEQETAAFVSGDGVKKPKGFLSAPQVAEASWTWGSVGYMATGQAGALPASNPSDVLIDLVYALKAGYRQNANWVMNRRTQVQLRKIKDADGNYLWQPSHQPGMRPSFMGFSLVEAEDMPDVGADTTPIAFGDFRRGYLIVDRLGVNVIRDPYSAKPYVLFYTTKRVGGGVLDFDAIKLLKYSAS